jgi:hypothetical protein
VIKDIGPGHRRRKPARFQQIAISRLDSQLLQITSVAAGADDGPYALSLHPQ